MELTVRRNTTTGYGDQRTGESIRLGCTLGMLVIFLCSVTTDASAQGSVESDRAALVVLYDAMGGPNWNDDTNWGSDEPLGEWTGVITDTAGRVISLSLSGNGLAGTLPVELGNLTKLRGLSLNQNALTGFIPVELGNLVNLEALFLSGNLLTGPLPPSLGDLVNLEKLYLSSNSLTGFIPASLGDLANLNELNLSANNFIGSIPATLGKLTNLTTLWLANSHLNGPIPAELGNLTNLQFLVLGNFDDAPSGGRNALTGRVPSTFGNLRNLDLLWLQANRLEGELPARLTELSLDGYLASTNQPTLRFEGNAGLMRTGGRRVSGMAGLVAVWLYWPGLQRDGFRGSDLGVDAAGADAGWRRLACQTFGSMRKSVERLEWPRGTLKMDRAWDRRRCGRTQ